METRLSGQDIGFDIDADDSVDGSLNFAPAAYLEDESSNFAKNFENRDFQSYELNKLSEALKTLDERSRLIIQKRWLDEHKATLQELSEELHISVERVRQIENATLKKIKELVISKRNATDPLLLNNK